MCRRLSVNPFILELNVALLAYEKEGEKSFAEPIPDLWFSDIEIASSIWLTPHSLRKWISPVVSNRSILMTTKRLGGLFLTFRYLAAEVRSYLKGKFEDSVEHLEYFYLPDFLEHLVVSEKELLELTYLTKEKLKTVPRFVTVRGGSTLHFPSFLASDGGNKWFYYHQTMKRFHPSYDKRAEVLRKSMNFGKPRYISWKEVSEHSDSPY